MTRAMLSEEVRAELAMLAPEAEGRPTSARALPAGLRTALAAAAPRRALPRPDELWRVACGALVWVDVVHDDALHGYLVHDAPQLAGRDELIVRSWDRRDGSERDVALCLWRRLRVPLDQAQARVGALAPGLRAAILRVRRQEGQRVATAERAWVWEAQGESGLLRWETGEAWGEEDPREALRAAWSARTEGFVERARPVIARLLEAARALVAEVDRTWSASLGDRLVIPPLMLQDAALRHPSALGGGASLVELELEVGDAQVIVCLEQRSDEHLMVSAHAQRHGAALPAASLTLTSPDQPPQTATTDADGLCELTATLTHERATLTLCVDEAVRVVEL